MAVKKKDTVVEAKIDKEREEIVGDTIEVNIPVEEEEVKEEPVVEIDEDSIEAVEKPESMVKIRMRENHRCCIALERYDLEKDKVYIVPSNVRDILNGAGLLSPL
jgi:hypothetical protein|nr:MAG TPA: hypothetical protein [Caudoviricetes sp.]